MSIFVGVLLLFGDSSHVVLIWTLAAMMEYFENWEALYVGAYNLSSNKCIGLLLGILSVTVLGPEFLGIKINGTEIRAWVILGFEVFVGLNVLQR